MNPVKRTKLWQRKALRWSAISITIGLTLLPILAITTILATTGANNLSSDDGNFINKFVDKIFDGTYHWQDFPRDTFFNTSCLLFPGLVYLGVAYFADFNVYVALYFGLLLTALKLLLLHKALTQSDPGGKVWVRWLLWPLLAALVFSVSQISGFEHELSAIAGGLSWFGFALGLWGLTRFPGQWRGVLMMVTGGVVATLSSGTGLMMWPIFLVGLILLGFRKVGHYVLWLGSAAVCALPYFVFLYINPFKMSSQATLLSRFNYWFIIDSLGRPFANGIGQNYSRMPASIWIGSLGIGLCVMGLILLVFLERASRRSALLRSAPAFMLIAIGLLTAWQVSLFRDLIAPWYTTWSMAFWIGLLGLAYVLWTNPAGEPHQGRRHWLGSPLIGRLWSMGVVIGLVVLYASSNLTYTDKSILLRTRSPSSAACLRNYRIAPTYCEETLVIWEVGDPSYIQRLAQPLERHQLSVFAPHQQWTLQGDFILDNVRISEEPGIPDIHWSADLTPTPVSFRNYRHLNLFLHTPNAISWDVSVPANTERADFYSAVAISQSVPLDPAADGAQFEVYLRPKGGEEGLVFSQYVAADQHQWHPFTIPLSAYAGQTITLRLTSNEVGNVGGDWAMYRYPYIDLQLNPAQEGGAPVSSKPFIPTLTDADTDFDIKDPTVWQTSNMQPMPDETDGTKAWTLDLNPRLQIIRPFDLRLADYTHFYVRAAAQFGFPIALQISYKLDHDPGFGRSVTIPLFPDGEMHGYTYDLKLLELDQQTRLTGIELHPVRAGSLSGKSWIKISDFRLLRGGAPIDPKTQAQSQLQSERLGGNNNRMISVADLIQLANSPQARKEPEDPIKNGDLIRVSAFTIEGATRQVLFMHPASSVTYNLRLPKHAQLQTSLALDPQTWQPGKGDGVEYTVHLKAADGRSHLLLDRYIDPKNIGDDRKWHDLSIDLSAYGGQDVALTLATLPGPQGDPTYDWAGWAEPRIVTSQLEDSSSKPRARKLTR